MLGGKSKNSTAISLPSGVIDDELPEKLEFPKLELFLLCMQDSSLRIPDQFFEEVRQLKVMELHEVCLLSLPSSLGCLMNLRTLRLIGCELGDIAIIGEMKKLEILGFCHSDIQQLPQEIGELTQLRLLSLTGCQKLKVIAPNVISRLSRLEELYIGDSFVQWNVERLNNQGPSNASLAELKQLSHLTSLDIRVQDAKIMPHEITIVEKLESFNIFIGLVWNLSVNTISTKLKGTSKIIEFTQLHSIILKCLPRLVSFDFNMKAPLISQTSLATNSCSKEIIEEDKPEDSMALFSPKVAFPSLEILTLSRLNNLQLIWNNQLHEDSFRTLKLLTIQFCGKLMSIVPSNIQANNLVQLKKLRLRCCGLEEIVAFKEVDGVLTFRLPQLERVHLGIFTRTQMFLPGVAYYRVAHAKRFGCLSLP
ncbi:hypothetical protein Patl1_27888 [Pistacia atlantica]|uniref:Uncharacterized protein n=1 Tax=Pistacia atlantica TaxID=434234 RepID=A0ACC1BDY3_9ROSI|nr:hypothetical protein Patl1_27888 [Pistacia atlantica]